MRLPVHPPLLPMLAKRVDELPEGSQWIFEPKWDGFRALVFRDGDEILIQSRDDKSLNRYFPDVVEILRAQLPARCVLDGEIVIATSAGLDFDALQLRLHPAASRVKLLASQTPASVVFFDLLCEGDRDLRNEPFQTRRKELEALLASARPPVHITPATDDRSVASDWFRRFEGAGLDGVMAKQSDGTYEPDKRTMLKVKHERDCDCVVAGFRWHKKGERTMVGSLLLGLFDETGDLQHVGVCASFTEKKRQELVEYLAPWRENALLHHPWKPEQARDPRPQAYQELAPTPTAGRRRPLGGRAVQKSWAEFQSEAGQRMPGGQSRWSAGKDLSWEPLRPELVVEVAYEHMQGRRFRHMSQFRRWRLDKSPRDCTYAQLEVVPPQELMEIFAAGR